MTIKNKKDTDESKPDNSPASSASDNRLAGGQDSAPQLGGSSSSQDTSGTLLCSDRRSYNLSELL